MKYMVGLIFLGLLGAGPLFADTAPPDSPALDAMDVPMDALVLDSSLCNTGNVHDQFQQALNAAAGGTLWIPNWCVVHLDASRSGTIMVPSNTNITCAGDGTSGFHDDRGFQCNGATTMISVEGWNNTVQGCVFTGNYDYSQARSLQQQTILVGRGCGGENAIQFTGGGNGTFYNNKVSNQYGDEAVFIAWDNGMTVNHDVFIEDFSNGLQTTRSSNSTIENSWFIDANIDIEDNGWWPPFSSNQVWTNNWFTCQQGDGLFLGQPNAGYTQWYGGECSWGTGLGCSSHPHDCTKGQYSGVTITGNTIDGAQAALLESANIDGEATGTNIYGNTFINGGHEKRS